jgi:hypothetical protein
LHDAIDKPTPRRFGHEKFQYPNLVENLDTEPEA